MKMIAKLAFGALIVTGFGCSSDASEVDYGYQERVDALFELTEQAEPQNTYTEVMRLEKGIAPDE